MKILVVVPTITSYLFLREFCRELAEKGWDVHLAASWTSLGQFESDTSRVTFHAIEFPRGMNPISHFSAAGKLNDIVKLIRPDIIDVHFSAAAFTAALAKKAYWPPTITTVQGLRFPLASGIQAIPLKHAECWSAKKLDAFVVLTSDDHAAMIEAGIHKCIQQEGFGFGCDLSKFDANRFTQPEIDKIRNEHGINENDIVFIFIGRLVAFKGFHLAVRAFFKAYSSKKNVKLLVCGEFDSIHPSGLTEKEIAEFKTHEGVINIGWTDKVDHFLSIADAVVFPSEREGVPVNLMEALSMGVPVITCNSRGCREVIESSEGGILLENRDVDSVVGAMLDIIDNPSKREQFSTAALTYRDNFDRQKFVSGHVELVESYL